VKIIETKILDITSKEPVSKQKIKLANKIIENVQPLLDKKYMEKVKKIKELKKNISSKKLKIKSEKKVLENLINDFTKKTKIKSLLNRINKLIDIGALNTQELKNEMTIVVKVIDDLPIDKINFYMLECLKILNNCKKN